MSGEAAWAKTWRGMEKHGLLGTTSSSGAWNIYLSVKSQSDRQWDRVMGRDQIIEGLINMFC